MRLSGILVLVAACGFELRPASQTVVDPDAQRIDSAFDAMVDAQIDAQIDAMIDAPSAVCGNGVLEAVKVGKLLYHFIILG